MYLAITVLIIMMGIIAIQERCHSHSLKMFELESEQLDCKDYQELKSEMDELKKRVDALTLRAGFKL